MQLCYQKYTVDRKSSNSNNFHILFTKLYYMFWPLRLSSGKSIRKRTKKVLIDGAKRLSLRGAIQLTYVKCHHRYRRGVLYLLQNGC